MNLKIIKPTILLLLAIIISACGSSAPTELPHTHDPAVTSQPSGGVDGSGIQGVQTFPDKKEYHQHVQVVPTAEGNLPPVFGAHFAAWQNCGIYDQSLELGHALHSMEHGAVWLTYRLDLPAAQVADLQNIARGHKYVLMSPYTQQTDDVVMTAWGVRLIIDSLPDDRIAQFISYYELGPQNTEPGAPCDGAFGTPIN